MQPYGELVLDVCTDLPKLLEFFWGTNLLRLIAGFLNSDSGRAAGRGGGKKERKTR